MLHVYLLPFSCWTAVYCVLRGCSGCSCLSDIKRAAGKHQCCQLSPDFCQLICHHCGHMPHLCLRDTDTNTNSDTIRTHKQQVMVYVAISSVRKFFIFLSFFSPFRSASKSSHPLFLTEQRPLLFPHLRSQRA